MLESDLYPVVRSWLIAHGCKKVCPEVPLQNRPIDVVGIVRIPELVVGIEMKVCMTAKVIGQAAQLQLCCDLAYIAVASRPRDIAPATSLGLGVLRVHDGCVEILAQPVGPFRPNDHYRSMLLSKASRMSGQGMGGVPCLDGVGPARDCKRRVDEYRREHPDANWGEIWHKVPNHYASPKSMSGALGPSMRRRDMFKALRRAENFAQ